LTNAFQSILPRVTVVMPVYNAGTYLRIAVESILAQSFDDFEFLIINDGSTDSGFEAIEGIRDNRIRILHNSKNQGLVACLNCGIDLARGDYLARMDADDLSHPERLKRQVDFLEDHPEIGVCSTWAVFIDAEGRELGTLRTPTGKKLQSFFWRPSPLVHAAVMVRSDLLRKHRYCSEFRDAEDYDLWLRLYGSTDFHNISKPLYFIRKHDASVSVVNRENQLRNSYRAFCRFVDHELVKYDEFLSLLGVNYNLSPKKWLRAYWRASRRTGIYLPTLLQDSSDYFRQWYRNARIAR
jgi:glycosyltransferase involved in cell wall biosynthesis